MTDHIPPFLLHPFPASFWSRVVVRAIAPELAYFGPLPQLDRQLREIQRLGDHYAYVYVISSEPPEVLYVGKTVNPTGRLNSHRRKKDWWPAEGNLILLGVDGDGTRDAEAAALHLESLAIRDLRPLYNIAGVSV